MKAKTEAYQKNLQIRLQDKKEIMTTIAMKKNELIAHERRVKREEFRIVKQQQGDINKAEAEEKKNRYGNVEKRDADLFSRKETDEIYQTYITARDKSMLEIQAMELNLDLARQEEKYLFKEIELHNQLISYTTMMMNAVNGMNAAEADNFMSKFN